MTTGSNPIPSAAPTAPLRGTQSLVRVMSFVWKHPSLTALELLWRWLAASPLLFLAWHTLAPSLTAIPLDTPALQNLTFFDPVRSSTTLAHQASLYLSAFEQTGKWLLPLALLVWTLAAALGRTAVLRRADPTLRPRLAAMAIFSLLRVLAFLLVLTAWSQAIRAAIHATITLPAQHNAEPSLVLLTALTVLITFAAFALWSTTVWFLDLAPIRALTPTTLATPHQRQQLRAKLIETNFVMGIVRVILLVLSLTFSASPLPFQSQETQAYINVWWTGVALFYILGSDFFHVVRRVTYLRLLQSIATGTNVPAPKAS